MLSTEELKNYVYNEVQTRLGEVSCGNLFFAEGTDNSVEGTYIFNKNNEYHILFTEKGKIRSDIVTDKKREVLWNAVNIISANIIINFAICNREKGKDFRRALFAKEKETPSGRNEIFIHGGGADGALPGFRNADDTGRGGVFRGHMRFRCSGGSDAACARRD